MVKRAVPELRSATQTSWSKSGSATEVAKTAAKVMTNSANIAAMVGFVGNYRETKAGQRKIEKIKENLKDEESILENR